MKISSCFPGKEVLFPNEEIDKVSMYTYIVEGCKKIKALGYDVVETNTYNINLLTDEEIEKISREYPNGSLGLVACNCFLSGWDSLTGIDEEERSKLYAYIEKIIEKMDIIGVEYIVFGSGGARKIKDEENPEKNIEEIENFLRHVDKCCENKQIVCVIEPLNKGETNWGNSVTECAKTVRKLDLPNVKLLADCYHMARENEDLSVIEENKDIILHCHIAAEDRSIPGNTQYEKDFLKMLKKIGYEGAVSVECHQPNFCGDAPKIIDFMRNAIAE